MYQFLLAILAVDALLLITIVLLQSGKGGGLAAMGAGGAGTDSLFGSRQTATLLTKATWWTGGIFLLLAFSLSLIGVRPSQSGSILRGAGTPAAETPAAPVTGIPGATAPVGGTAAPAAPATVPDSQ